MVNTMSRPSSRENPITGGMYSPAEVAAHLSVTRRTVYNWLDSGRLTAYKVGDVWRISQEQLDAFKEAGLRKVIHLSGPGPAALPAGPVRVENKPAVQVAEKPAPQSEEKSLAGGAKKPAPSPAVLPADCTPSMLVNPQKLVPMVQAKKTRRR